MDKNSCDKLIKNVCASKLTIGNVNIVHYAGQIQDINFGHDVGEAPNSPHALLTGSNKLCAPLPPRFSNKLIRLTDLEYKCLVKHSQFNRLGTYPIFFAKNHLNHTYKQTQRSNLQTPLFNRGLQIFHKIKNNPSYFWFQPRC